MRKDTKGETIIGAELATSLFWTSCYSYGVALVVRTSVVLVHPLHRHCRSCNGRNNDDVLSNTASPALQHPVHRACATVNQSRLTRSLALHKTASSPSMSSVELIHGHRVAERGLYAATSEIRVACNSSYASKTSFRGVNLPPVYHRLTAELSKASAQNA